MEDDSELMAPPRPLRHGDGLDRLDCGIRVFDDWLKNAALGNEEKGASRTFVLSVRGTVIAYYTLSAAQIDRAAAIGRARRNMPDPVPAVRLGRLAVDRRYQGQGLGSDLLGDAVTRIVRAAEIIGIRVILLDAISERAAEFYRRRGFRPGPGNPLTMMITVDDALRALAEITG